MRVDVEPLLQIPSCPPAVSVVVPAHNAAATLGDCLGALAASVGPPVEVVVVDDASTDATAEIAARSGARLVRLPHQSGAAVARNAGAAHATADLLFFTDADVLVTPDAVARAVAVLKERPDVSAVFGSYTAHTVHSNFCSVYKNLTHHLTHQAACPDATTFWSGAGAIRAAAFWAVGGFDPADTRTADVEDIALGYRLTRAGYQIRLERDLQVTHAKRYTLVSLVRSDVLHRAIPWTCLMLRERIFRRDLNTADTGLAGAALVALMGSSLLISLRFGALRWGIAPLFGIYVALHRRLLAALARHDVRFVIPGIAMTMLYYVYAVIGALIGVLIHVRRIRPSSPSSRSDRDRISPLPPGQHPNESPTSRIGEADRP